MSVESRAWRPEAGQVIAGRYRLERQLGAGGMGVVFAATHLVTHEEVALKLMLPELGHLTEAVQRFLGEARAASRIRHPNVIDIRDAGIHEGAPYIAMELLRGEDLAAKLAREGALDVGVARELLMPVLDALEAAHAAGIVHRDLKPENIFLEEDPRSGGVRPKVLDFGISKLASPSAPAGRLTQTGAMLGTPLYMAPEQLRGARDVDARADLYSLGVVFFELLTGRVPHEAESFGELVITVVTKDAPPVSSLRRGLGVEVDRVVARLLARDANARFPDVPAVREALLALPAVAASPTPGAASSRPQDTGPLGASAAGVAWPPLEGAAARGPSFGGASPTGPAGWAADAPWQATPASAGTPRWILGAAIGAAMLGLGVVSTCVWFVVGRSDTSHKPPTVASAPLAPTTTASASVAPVDLDSSAVSGAVPGLALASCVTEHDALHASLVSHLEEARALRERTALVRRAAGDAAGCRRDLAAATPAEREVLEGYIDALERFQRAWSAARELARSATSVPDEQLDAELEEAAAAWIAAEVEARGLVEELAVIAADRSDELAYLKAVREAWLAAALGDGDEAERHASEIVASADMAQIVGRWREQTFEIVRGIAERPDDLGEIRSLSSEGVFGRPIRLTNTWRRVLTLRSGSLRPIAHARSVEAATERRSLLDCYEQLEPWVERLHHRTLGEEPPAEAPARPRCAARLRRFAWSLGTHGAALRRVWADRARTSAARVSERLVDDTELDRALVAEVVSAARELRAAWWAYGEPMVESDTLDALEAWVHGPSTLEPPTPDATQRVSVRVASLRASGVADNLVRRAVDRHMSALRVCHASVPEAPAGVMVVHLAVGARGTIESRSLVQTQLRTRATEVCVLDLMRSWTFPAPDEGAGQVWLGLEFRTR